MDDPDARKKLYEKISTLSRILVDLDNLDAESEAVKEGIRAARDALLSMMASPSSLMNTASAEGTVGSLPAVIPDESLADSQEHQAPIFDALVGLSWSFLDPIQGEPAPTSEPDEGLALLLGYLDEQHPNGDVKDSDSVSLFSIGDRSHCTLGMVSPGAHDTQPAAPVDRAPNTIPVVEPPSPVPLLTAQQGNHQVLGDDSSAQAFEPANLSFEFLDNSGANDTGSSGILGNDWKDTDLGLDLPFDPGDTENLGLYGSVNLEFRKGEIEAMLDEAIAFSNQALGPLPGSASAPVSEPFVPGLVQTQSPNSYTNHNGLGGGEVNNRNNLAVNPGFTGNTPAFTENTAQSSAESILNLQTPGNTAHDPIVLDLDDNQPVNNRVQASHAARRGRPYANQISINGRSVKLPRGRATSLPHQWTTQRSPYGGPRIPPNILPQYVATTTRDYSLEGRLAARERRKQMEMHIERIDEENKNQNRPG